LLGLLIVEGVPGPVTQTITGHEAIAGQGDADNDGGDNDDEPMLGIYETSRAHIMPKTKRELYMNTPIEGLIGEDGDVVGRLHRYM